MNKRSLIKHVILLIFIGSFLAGCNGIEIPDFWACVNLSETTGYCHTSASNKEQLVNEASKIDNLTWSELKASGIYLTPDGYGELKKFILKVCEKTRECSVDQATQTFQRIEMFNSSLDK